MSRIITALLVCLFAVSRPILAEEPEGRTDVSLRVAVSREVTRMVELESIDRSTRGSEFAGAAAQGLRPVSGWPKRHPVLFGALIGAGLGAAAAASIPPRGQQCAGGYFCPEVSRERALVGFALLGAGAGALVGLIAWSD